MKIVPRTLFVLLVGAHSVAPADQANVAKRSIVLPVEVTSKLPAGTIPIDVSSRNAQTAVYERTDGRGADVVIEAVGTPAAFERSLDIVRRGGKVVVMGVFTSELVQAQIGVWWIRALQIRFAGTTPIHAWWEEAMAEVQAGRLDPTPIVSHRLPLEEAPKGYELFDTRQASKVLLRP